MRRAKCSSALEIGIELQKIDPFGLRIFLAMVFAQGNNENPEIGLILYWAIVETVQGQVATARQHLQSELQTAVQRQDKLNLANIFAAAAYTQATNNEAVSAVELYSLAQRHPFIANSRWFADVVGKRVAESGAALIPDNTVPAVASGEFRDIWKTAEWLQEWLAEMK